MPLVVGYWLQRSSHFARGFYDNLIKIALLVIFPLLAIMSFWVIRIDMDIMWLPAFGVLLHLVPGLLAYLIVNRVYNSPADRGSYLLSAILSNQMVVGGISVYILYGETGFAYVQLAVLLQGLILFLFCFPLAQYYQRCAEGGGKKFSAPWWSLVFNRNQIGVLGIVAGVILNKTGWERPAIGNSLFDLLVHLNAWMALVPVGHSIRFSEFRSHLSGVVSMSAIKFVVTPLIMAGLSILLLKDPLMRNTLLILAFSPTAINAVIAVRLHGLNSDMVMTHFILTTALYLFIVYPLIFLCLYR